MNLRYIERINKLTWQIIETRREVEERERQAPHKSVGAWRHAYNIDALKARAEFLERKRLALFRTAPRVLRGV
jgi:hypothetical protein